MWQPVKLSEIHSHVGGTLSNQQTNKPHTLGRVDPVRSALGKEKMTRVPPWRAALQRTEVKSADIGSVSRATLGDF